MDPPWDLGQAIRGTNICVLFSLPKMILGFALANVHVEASLWILVEWDFLPFLLFFASPFQVENGLGPRVW